MKAGILYDFLTIYGLYGYGTHTYGVPFSYFYKGKNGRVKK